MKVFSWELIGTLLSAASAVTARWRRATPPLPNFKGAMEFSEYRPRELRFRLGELLLGSWRPRLAEASVILGRDSELIRSQLPDHLPRDSDGLVVHQVSADLFPTGLRRSGKYLEYVPKHDALYVVDIAGTFEGYLAKNFTAKARQNLSRAVRRLSEAAGGPPWSVYTEESQMEEFHRQAALISQSTYQHRVLKGGLDGSPETLEMLREMARNGVARGYLLKLRGEPIAFAWCERNGRRLAYEIIGFSTAHAARSPGNVLLYWILADQFARRDVDVLEFGPGWAAYKSMFSTREKVAVDAYFLRPTAGHAVLAMSHFGLYRVSVALSLALDHWGLKKRVKAAVRRLHGVS